MEDLNIEKLDKDFNNMIKVYWEFIKDISDINEDYYIKHIKGLINNFLANYIQFHDIHVGDSEIKDCELTSPISLFQLGDKIAQVQLKTVLNKKDMIIPDKVISKKQKNNENINYPEALNIRDNHLIYDQVIEYCKENNIKIKDFYNSIGITDVGFRKTWRKKNPQSIETLIDIIDFMRKNKKNV